MMLATRVWGSGPRTAVLVHGIMTDSRTWNRVAPAVADRGYRVIAVDLRGHGASGHGENYTPAVLAADLLETLPPAPDLAIGHSLGSAALLTALPRLRCARAIHCDPAWVKPAPGPGRPARRQARHLAGVAGRAPALARRRHHRRASGPGNLGPEFRRRPDALARPAHGPGRTLPGAAR